MTHYRILPFEWREHDDQIALVRGGYTAKFSDPGIADLLTLVLGKQDAPLDVDAVRAELAAPEKPLYDQLIEFLLARRILVPLDADSSAQSFAAETPKDVFFWEFSTTANAVSKSLSEVGVAIVGINRVSYALCDALQTAGTPATLLVDDPLLRNREYFDGATLNTDRWNCPLPIIAGEQWDDGPQAPQILSIVACSDYGATHHMSRWNADCVQNDKHFFPVILEKYVGRIGPLVIPGESACYGCLQGRENATQHLRFPYEQSPTFAYDKAAAFLPSMATALGAMASLELIKFYANLSPTPHNRVVEFNFIGGKSTSRHVLKLPRCPVCCAMVVMPPVQLTKAEAIPIQEIPLTHGK